MIIIESVSYKSNLFDWRKIVFNRGINLLYSRENTKGKTTALRIMLFAMGFVVPDMHDVDFSQMQFKLEIRNNKGEFLVIERKFKNSSDTLSICVNGQVKDYGLYSELHSEIKNYVFGIENKLIQNNLLGVFYIDQEKGWSMFNRGKVIGNISFSIEEFLCGLGDIDIAELKAERDKINTDLKEYKSLLSLSNLDASFQAENAGIPTETSFESRQKEKSTIKFKLSYLERELKNLKEALQDNDSLLSMIEKYCIRVMAPNGDEILVTRDNIVLGSANLSYLRSRIKILEIEHAQLKKAYANIQQEIDLQLGNFSDEDLLCMYKSKIQNLELSFNQISDIIETLENRKNTINSEIRKLADNSYSYNISKQIMAYLVRLDVKHHYSHGTNVVLTNKLARYAGAEFSKRVLAFRFAYLKAIEKSTGLCLPIIIDSPYAKEIDGANFERMMDILSNDFKGHQIIIASIKDEITSPHFRINVNRGIFEYPITYLAIPRQV